jgi:predicted HicB family RNase H-like nuclease
MMEYKGYLGSVEFDDQAGVIHGEVINTRDVITFQGRTVAEVREAFHESVDDYLEFCRQRGESPDKPFSGQFVTRITPDLHRRVNAAARLAGKSLNAWVTDQLQTAVSHAIAGDISKPRGTPQKPVSPRDKADTRKSSSTKRSPK